MDEAQKKEERKKEARTYVLGRMVRSAMVGIVSGALVICLAPRVPGGVVSTIVLILLAFLAIGGFFIFFMLLTASITVKEINPGANKVRKAALVNMGIAAIMAIIAGTLVIYITRFLGGVACAILLILLAGPVTYGFSFFFTSLREFITGKEIKPPPVAAAKTKTAATAGPARTAGTTLRPVEHAMLKGALTGYDTYEVYAADNEQDALDFLNAIRVTEGQYYVVVETPDAVIARDRGGVYRPSKSWRGQGWTAMSYEQANENGRKNFWRFWQPPSMPAGTAGSPPAKEAPPRPTGAATPQPTGNPVTDYKRALAYLDACGPFDEQKLREMNRIAGNMLSESTIRELLNQAKMIMPNATDSGGMEFIKASVREQMVTFIQMTGKLGFK